MKVGIVGSRNLTNQDKIIPLIARFLRDHTHGPVTVICGRSGGVSNIAKDYANHIGLDVVVFDPIYKLDRQAQYNPKHYLIRNKQIVENSDKVLAIWDGESQGTEHAIMHARSLGVPIMIVTF